MFFLIGLLAVEIQASVWFWMIYAVIGTIKFFLFCEKIRGETTDGNSN